MALYGYPPPLVIESKSRGTRMAKLEEWLEERQVMNRMVREQLMDLQNRMKFFKDKKRTERQFEKGIACY